MGANTGGSEFRSSKGSRNRRAVYSALVGTMEGKSEL